MTEIQDSLAELAIIPVTRPLLLCMYAGLSAALFAPAWVWEVGNKLDWLQRQQDFWAKIQACWEQPRPLVRQLPFSTCFDQGAGTACYSEVRL